MAKTKLEAISYEDLNKANANELAKMLKNALRSTYMKMDALHYRGYKESKYNGVFRSMMGETRAQAVKHVDDLLKDGDFSELKRLTYYTKRHMKHEDASVQGVEKREKRGFILLEKIVRGLGPGDEFNPKIERERTKEKGSIYETEGFRIEDSFFTHKDLSDIWKLIRKVDELQSLKTYKSGSGEAIQEIVDIVIKNEKDNPLTATDVHEQLMVKQKEYDEKDAKKEKEYADELDKIKEEGDKKKGRRRYSTRM